jgi:predicted DNA-binding protein
MQKKPCPMTTYSVRLSLETVKALEARASEHQSVGAVIRAAIDEHLSGLEGEDILAQMEQRIVATIMRISKQHVSVSRKIDFLTGQTDYVRRQTDLYHLGKQDPEETHASRLQRGDQAFFNWANSKMERRLALLRDARTRLPIILEDASDEPEELEPTKPEVALAVPAPKPSGRLDPLVNAVTEPTITPAQTREPQPAEPAPEVPAPRPSPIMTASVAAPTWR